MNKKKQLPDGWHWAKLGDVARVFMGGSAPQNQSHFAEGGVPFFRVSDLSVEGRTSNLTNARDCIKQDAIPQLRLVKAQKGTVLFPKSGAAVATNNRAILGADGYIVSHLMAIEAGELITPKWLYMFLCQVDMMEHADNISYPSVKKSVVEKIRLPLPPLSAQEEITALFDRKITAVEKARLAAEEELRAINALPASLLREVFGVE